PYTPALHSFPTRRSSDLPRSRAEILNRHIPHPSGARDAALHSQGDQERDRIGAGRGVTQVPSDGSPALNLRSADYRRDFSETGIDRKSTRLNSSHVAISY